MRTGPASRRTATILRCLGLVIGALLLAAGAAIAVLALHGLHTLPPPEIGPDGQSAFRCGMPVAAAIVALLFALPTAGIGGMLMAWCQPARTQPDR